MSGKKTAIVTGASGGIGAGLVEGFLIEGYNVVATSRHANRELTTSGALVLLDGDEVAARSHKQLVSPLRPNLRISFSPTLGK